jgi:RNA polymerase-binding transcription factor DksA
MTDNYDHLRTKLEEEKRSLEASLGEVGRPNPDQPGNWEVTPAPNGDDVEFNDELADRLEEASEREETEVELEGRLKEVTQALERLAAGTYGICEIGGEAIEADRLEANPAARTCKQHLNDGENLK